VADDRGLWIIDISNPSSPTFVGFHDPPSPALARGVYVSGSYAYVAENQYGLQIIDISDPSHPTLTDSDDTLGDAWGVYVSGQYAYVTVRYGGLQIFKFSDWSVIPSRAMPCIPLLLF
jgi:hypothetical protein